MDGCMKNILVVGSLNMDYVTNVDTMPKAGETIFAENFIMNPGGKGANQAYAIAKLGGKVAMIGAVGQDPSGTALIENLKGVGVDVDGIERVDAPTGAATIIVENDGQNRIMVNKGANSYVDRCMIDRHKDLLRWSDIVVMQLEIPLDTVEYVAEKAHRLGKIVIVDPAPAPKVQIDDILKNADYIKPNSIEAMELANCFDSIENAVECLLSKGVGQAIVTLGEKGAQLYKKGCLAKAFASVPTNVIDTTAAGDCFTGAFAVAIAMGKDVEEAIGFATKASAVSVSRPGAQMSMPSYHEVAE